MRDVEAFGAECLEVERLEADFPRLGSGYQIRRMALRIRHQKRLLEQDVLCVGRLGETIVPWVSQGLFLP
jgi:hypothetical protein